MSLINNTSLSSFRDAYANALHVIETGHAHIHNGYAFHASHRVASLANLGTHDILIAVAANTYPHVNAIIFSISDSPADAVSYEGATTSADGTGVTVVNRNRNSSATPGSIVTHTPTVTDPGTKIHDRFIPNQGGTGSQDVGIISPAFGEEWILKPSTKYLIRLTNNSGGAITLTYEVLWYEIGAS